MPTTAHVPPVMDVLVVGAAPLAPLLADRLRARCSTSITGEPREIWSCVGLLPTTASSADAASALEEVRAVAAYAHQHGVRLHHISTMAVAGGFEGSFTEKQFDEGQPLDDVLAQSAFDQELAVRAIGGARIYRLAHLLADSPAAVDGPAHFFEALLMTSLLMRPSWPLYGPDFGQTDVIPLSYAATALAALGSIETEHDCFHIGSGVRLRTADVHNAFATVARAPRAYMLERDSGPGDIAWRTYSSFMQLPQMASLRQRAFALLSVPELALGRLAHEFAFDCTHTTELLKSVGVRCPALEAYAPDVWRYWRELRINP